MCFEYHTKNGANSTTLTRGEVETRESQTRGLSVNSVADSLSGFSFLFQEADVGLLQHPRWSAL